MRDRARETESGRERDGVSELKREKERECVCMCVRESEIDR